MKLKISSYHRNADLFKSLKNHTIMSHPSSSLLIIETPILCCPHKKHNLKTHKSNKFNSTIHNVATAKQSQFSNHNVNAQVKRLHSTTIILEIMPTNIYLLQLSIRDPLSFLSLKDLPSNKTNKLCPARNLRCVCMQN